MKYLPDTQLDNMSYEKLYLEFNNAQVSQNILRQQNEEDQELNKYVQNLEARLRTGKYQQISYTAEELLERIKIPYEEWDGEETRHKKDTRNALRVQILQELIDERIQMDGKDIGSIQFTEIDWELFEKKVAEEYEYRVDILEEVTEAFVGIHNVVGPTLRPRWYRRLQKSVIVAGCLLLIVAGYRVATNGGMAFIMQIIESFNDFFYRRDVITGEVEFEGEIEGLQDFFNRYKIEGIAEPTWLPDGYVFYKSDIDNWEDRSRIRADYLNENDDLLSITVVSFKESFKDFSHDIEKDNGTKTKFTVNGIEVTIVPDLSRKAASWCDAKCEFRIVGAISEKDIEKIVRSMYPEE